MTAIIKKELYSYFNSAIGYIVLGVFTFFSGLFFYVYCLMQYTSSMTYVFLSMLMFVMLIVPIITMRSFSEERKQKTDQALLTAPISLTEMVLGKFIAAFLLYCLCNAVFVLYAFILCFFAAPDWALFMNTLFGMLLLGAALIAIDLFISVLSESQAVAAVVSIGVGLLIYTFDSLIELVNVGEWISWFWKLFGGELDSLSASKITEWFTNTVLKSISFDTHFTNFINGIINLPSVFFFLSVTAGFLFLCIRTFEKRRWS